MIGRLAGLALYTKACMACSKALIKVCKGLRFNCVRLQLCEVSHVSNPRRLSGTTDTSARKSRRERCDKVRGAHNPTSNMNPHYLGLYILAYLANQRSQALSVALICHGAWLSRHSRAGWSEQVWQT